ncbi:hypothetical protein YTPLAS21_19240 [Candidatus Nitrosocosmicus sp.]|nr:hypothetical protein YTPLAS21_19240 [Candidatus Nitrosocosmicus sp.]
MNNIRDNKRLGRNKMNIDEQPLGLIIRKFTEYTSCMAANNVDIGIEKKGAWNVFMEWRAAEKLNYLEKITNNKQETIK